MKQRIKLPRSTGSLVLPVKFCIVCGKSHGADTRTFDHREANAVAEFSRLVGDVSVFADYLLNKTLSIEAPFCRKCHGGFLAVEKRSQLLYVGFLLTILATIISATYIASITQFEYSLFVVAVGLCIAIGFRCYRRYAVWKLSPKIRKLTKKKLVLRVPTRGVYVFERSL
jgi:hypothetical protein